MHTVNNVFKWSCYISGVTGLLILSGVLAIWFLIEVLVLLIEVNA